MTLKRDMGKRRFSKAKRLMLTGEGIGVKIKGKG